MASSTTNDESSAGMLLIKIMGAFIVLIFAVFFLNPLVVIGVGNQGILLTWGAPTGVLEPGIHFITPFAQRVVTMNTQTQVYSTFADAASADLQQVDTNVALNYHLDPSQVQQIYANIGDNNQVQTVVISPAVQEAVKATAAQFNAEQLIENRTLVKLAMENSLSARLAQRGIIEEALSITDFNFSAQFNTAIEAKQVAQQNVLTQENILQATEIQAQQQAASAEGTANATLIQAQANADAIRIQQQALASSNNGVLTLLAIQKWNGVLPQVISSSTGASILLPINQTFSQVN